MSQLSSQEAPQFGSDKEELQYWKRSYHELDRKYQQLLACHTCSIQVQSQDPAIPMKVDHDSTTIPTDPIALPEPCAYKIMNYLSGKELLTATEVSKTWKEFVETRESLMQRAMNEVIVKPDLSFCSLPLINSLFDVKSDRRPYKHMKGPFCVLRKIKHKVFPISFHASTLVTLNIDECIAKNYNYFNQYSDDYDDDLFCQSFCFPKLCELKIRCNMLRFIGGGSFPNLTCLRIESNGDPMDDFDMEYEELLLKLLESCPNLKILHACDELISEAFRNPTNIPIQDNDRLPKIESCILESCHPIILIRNQSSLKKLKVHEIEVHEISWCLGILKELDSLSICIISNDSDPPIDERTFPRNESIETLNLHITYSSEAVFPRWLQNLLLALPSLKKLAIGNHHKTPSLIKFLATNMRHLEELACLDATEEIFQAIDEVRNNPQQYVNTTFKFESVEKYIF